MTTMHDHLDPNDLAALADGAGSADLHLHLAGCRSCLAAYAEAVRVAHLRALRPEAFAVPPDLLAAGLAAGAPRRPAATTTNRSWRPALAATAATAVLVVAVALSPEHQTGHLDGDDIATIGALLREQSLAGPVLPGVSPFAGGGTPVYRAGSVPTPDLDRALREAARKHGASPRDPQQAFWLGAGYLSAGQLGTAVDLIRLARQAYPQDQPLLVLEGVAAYRASELARAETLLREAVRRNPADAVARFDLAVVLAEAGRTWEAQQVLAAGTWAADSDVARRAAAMADSLP